MKYSKIAGVAKPVSKIILGTSTPAFMRGENCNALLDCALSLGINAFDTARVYGRAEKALGRWLAAPGVRERAVVISKCCHPDIFGRRRVNARAMRADLKKSLSALGTDYIDIYLLHRDDLSVPAGTVVEELNALHSDGRIGAFGGSNWTHRRIEEANEYAYKRGLIPFAVSSPNYSLARQYGDPWGGGVSICGEEGAAAREWYAACGMPVIAYSSLARGVLSGRIKSGEFAGAGATIPLTGFGHTLAQGAIEGAREHGLLGALFGGLNAAAAGISAAVIFGYLNAVIFSARTKP